MDLKDPKTLRAISDFSRVILGVLVALAWKEPIQYFATTFLPEGAAFFALLFFAVVITAVAIVVMLKVADMSSQANQGQSRDQQVDADTDSPQAQPEAQNAEASTDAAQTESTTNDF